MAIENIINSNCIDRIQGARLIQKFDKLQESEPNKNNTLCIGDKGEMYVVEKVRENVYKINKADPEQD